jgi:hypothetical protein
MNEWIICISLLGPCPTPLEWIPCKYTIEDNIQSIIILDINSIKSTYNVKHNKIKERTSFIF